VWDEAYSLPEDAPPRADGQFCTRTAGAPTIRFASIVAVRVIEEFIADGTQRTLLVNEDMRVLE
jgi:hypothetical protein